MGSAILKRLKWINNNIPPNDNTGMIWYVFDRFYRYVTEGQPGDVIPYIYQGYNIYCTHTLSVEIRNMDNISDIQAVSYYFRPSVDNVDLLQKIKSSNSIIVAGLTANNGLRIVVPVNYFGSVGDPILRYKYCYDKVLHQLKDQYNNISPKSSSNDVLGCIGPVIPEGSIVNLYCDPTQC